MGVSRMTLLNSVDFAVSLVRRQGMRGGRDDLCYSSLEMNRSKIIGFLTLALAASAVQAQSTIKESLVKHWKTTGEFTLAVAKAMPAEDYKFKPVPAEQSVGELMAHIGVADMNACSIASGKALPMLPPSIKAAMSDEKGEVDKDAAISFLSSSFDFCNAAVESMTTEKLDATVGTKRKMTGFEWLWSYFTHTAHHRGQAEVYLRLKGIKPPTYTF